MPIPSPRNKLLPARGEYATLEQALPSLFEGEFVWANDTNKYYQVVGGALQPVTVNPSELALVIQSVSDVDAKADQNAADIVLNSQNIVAESNLRVVNDTALQNQIDDLGTDASALTDRVGQNEQDISSNASAISGVQSDVSDIEAALPLKADLVDGLVPTSQLPGIAISEFLGDVADEAAMLALVGQKGDWCIRTDVSDTYVITGDDPSLLTSWTELATPASPVTSVNTQTGAVVLGAADVGAIPAADAPNFAPSSVDLQAVTDNGNTTTQSINIGDDLTLRASDGEITSGVIQSGGDPLGGGEVGVRIDGPSGGIVSTAAAGGNSILKGFTKDGDVTSQIDADGSAFFGSGTIKLNSAGEVQGLRATRNPIFETYQGSDFTAGNRTGVIYSDGSAKFNAGTENPGAVVIYNNSGDQPYVNVQVDKAVSSPAFNVQNVVGESGNVISLNSDGSASFASGQSSITAAGGALSSKFFRVESTNDDFAPFRATNEAGDTVFDVTGSGSITASGDIQSGGNPYTASPEAGVRLDSTGGIVLARSSGALLTGKDTDTGATTAEINADGSAEFASGNIELNSYGQGIFRRSDSDSYPALSILDSGDGSDAITFFGTGAASFSREINTTGDDSYYSVNRTNQSGTAALYLGFADGVQKFKVGIDGSAEFDATVVVAADNGRQVELANSPAGGVIYLREDDGTRNIELDGTTGNAEFAGDLNLTDSTIDLYSQTTNSASKTFQLFSDIGGAKTEQFHVAANGSVLANSNLQVGYKDPWNVTNATAAHISRGSIELYRDVVSSQNGFIQGYTEVDGEGVKNAFSIYTDGSSSWKGAMVVNTSEETIPDYAGEFTNSKNGTRWQAAVVGCNKTSGGPVWAGLAHNFAATEAGVTSQILENGDAYLKGRLEVNDAVNSGYKQGFLAGVDSAGSYLQVYTQNGNVNNAISVYNGDIGKTVASMAPNGQINTYGAFVAKGDDPDGYLFQGTTSAGVEVVKISTDGGSEFEGRMTVGGRGDTTLNDHAIAAYNNTDSSQGIATIFGQNMGNGRLIDLRGSDSNIRMELESNGNAAFSGTVSAQGSVLTSDAKFKTDVTDAASQLDDVVALGNSLRNWTWTEDAPVADKETRFLGLIAQEAEEICPGIVTTMERGEEDSYKAIKNDVLVMKLLGAVAELKAEVEDLKQKLAEA